MIGKLLSSPPSKGQLQKAIERLSRQTYQHPINVDRWISLGASTIEQWYYKAKAAADPIAALGRRIRSDAGIRWSMSVPLLAALAKEQPRLGPMVSNKTVLRCMHQNGWRQIHQPALPTAG